jgi:hypothetical protein
MLESLKLTHMLRLGAVFLGMMLNVSICHAEDGSLWERMSLSGFGSFSVSRSSDDEPQYVRDLQQPYGLSTDWSAKVDSVFGLQADVGFTSETKGVVQVQSRYRYDGSYQPEISWAFISHDYGPDMRLRLGRMGTEFYLLGDSRQIGYANLTVRPPPDFFGQLVFNYFDGADFSVTSQFGQGVVRAKLFYGYSSETTAFVPPLEWDLSGSRLMGGYLDYLTGPWQFRYTHAEVKFGSEAPVNEIGNAKLYAYLSVNNPAALVLLPVDIQGQVPDLSTLDTTSRFDSLAVLYDDGPVQFLGMYGTTKHQALYPDTRSWFVQAGYRMGHFTPFVGYSMVKSDTNEYTHSDPLVSIAANGIAAIARTDRHTTTLGVRWDLASNLDVKLQVDDVRGNSDSMYPARGTQSGWDGHTQVYTLSLDFVF